MGVVVERDTERDEKMLVNPRCHYGYNDWGRDKRMLVKEREMTEMDNKS